MKLDNYELIISFAMPCYLYIEGESKEKFYVDEQTCDYYLFNDKDAEPKFWKIMLYKPNNIKHVDKNNIHLCKWLVNESYHELVYDDSDDDTDYECYEWDFKKHCIKKMNIWYEDIYKYLLRIKEITDIYKNPLINDSGGASICNDIDKKVDELIKMILFK